MLKKSYIHKVIVVTIFMMVMPFAFAALTLTGSVDEKAKSNKYSLKNLSRYSQKSFSMSLLRTNMQYKGFLSVEPKSNNAEYNSFMQIDRGNTTYVLPYKMKLKAPKFKTPSPNN